jgi:hypothetical protein
MNIEFCTVVWLHEFRDTASVEIFWKTPLSMKTVELVNLSPVLQSSTVMLKIWKFAPATEINDGLNGVRQRSVVGALLLIIH